MRAIVNAKYGSPDIFEIKEVVKPIPIDNEVFVKIHASTVTPADWRYRKGDPFWARIVFGLFKPKNNILGAELSGEIEAIGKKVNLYKVGDRIIASSYMLNYGAYAQYKCIPEDGMISIKPININFEEPAAIPMGANTALHFLKKCMLNSRDESTAYKQKILIYGASGRVGTYAVQLARYFGAEVTGVCCTSNIELIKSPGANNVIDYTKEDFTKLGMTWDVIFDTVGKTSVLSCKKLLKNKGSYLCVFPSPQIMFQMLWTSIVGDKKVIYSTATESGKDLILLKDLIESENIKPVIDKCYSMGQIAEAHRYVEKGHKIGNVAITIEH